MCQHTVNVKAKGHVLDGLDHLLVLVLHAGSQHVPHVVPGGGNRGESRSRGPRRARNGQRGAERVARGPAVLHGRVQAEGLHLDIADGAAGGGDLDDVALGISRQNSLLGLSLGVYRVAVDVRHVEHEERDSE